MGNTRVAFSLLALLCLATADVLGAPIVLKEYSAPGYTFAAMADTEISGYQTSSRTDEQMNWGGAQLFSNLYQNTRVMLLKPDLQAIPDSALVSAVNSATLRIYRTSNTYGNGAWYVGQLGEDWIEGTGGGTWDTTCDGAQWHVRNGGTIVDKSTFVGDGPGIWYVDGMADLADDPINKNPDTTFKKHVRPANNMTNFYNGQNSYTQANSLAELQALGTTRGYYYDSASGRLYLNKNDVNIRWYSTADRFSTAGAAITGAYTRDNSAPSYPPVPGWIEFDVTAIVQNWLLSSQPNYGFRIYGQSENKIVASEYTTDPTLRPELVLDLAYVPEPGTLGLLLLGTLGVFRRRR